MASNAEMVDYIWPISTNYVFGGSRYEPYNTDCSGMVCAAFWHVHGVDPYSLGDWTGAQWNNGLLTQIWWGTDTNFPWGSMQKGDVIFTSTTAPNFDTGEGSHVGFYTGDPNAPFLSHFANGGPYVTAVNGVYGGNERYYGLARYMPGSEEDMDKGELISTRDSGNIPAWQAWSWAYTYAKDAVEKVAAVEKKVAALQSTVNNLKISGATVDYDKLADKVADKVVDKIAARMKD